ncbi:MAG: FAD-dependent oxidoreductase [Thermotogae bacterium]|jgi:thioredoxin reductase/Fe-S-cluster-containing hydrogenase component 2|nr:FAD-dependent oxidoreductase [Thermotogota bacterium]MCL5031893.1 FAD-dependent oxidoreductase [Thermotogota bacterium]
MKEYDAVVIGGGPAGMAAADVLGDHVKTLILDENDMLGGQLVKQTHKFFGDHVHYASTRGFEIANKFIDKIEKKPVDILTSSTVIGIYPQNTVAYVRNGHEDQVKYKKLIIATGAMERQLPFINSDLPGVYGAGAVQTLMNQYGIFPGKRFLIIGSGNIGLILAYQLAQTGVEVRAIVEALDKIGGYEVHANKAKRLGIPILLKHTIVKAIGDESVQGAIIAEVDDKFNVIAGTEKEIVVDTICISVGLMPITELTEQAKCKIAYIPELGGYVPVRDERMRTTNPDVFVAGDLSSIEEATTAMIEGKLAAMQIVEDVKKIDLEKEISNEIKTLAIFRSGPKSLKIRSGLEKMGIVTPRIEMPKFSPLPNSENGKLHAVIECTEEIPCNSCESACKFDAIKVGENINTPPVFDPLKCTGCAVCVTVCPGLAIFMEKSDESPNATLGIPYEFLPLPKSNEKMWGMDRDGNYVCDLTVKRVVKNPNKTYIVYVDLPKEFVDVVRHVTYPRKENPFVCRCEEITVDQIEKVIDSGITDFEEIKRITRVTMGPCGGKNCKMIILGIISKKTGIPISKLSHGTSRPPVKVVEFSAFLRGDKK